MAADKIIYYELFYFFCGFEFCLPECQCPFFFFLTLSLGLSINNMNFFLPEPLLSCSVPDLQFDPLSWFNLHQARKEVHSHSGV